MESIKVYAKRILPDLKSASEHFSDVQLVSNEQVDYCINTNSLILASLSPTLNSALKDLFNRITERFLVHLIYRIANVKIIETRLVGLRNT